MAMNSNGGSFGNSGTAVYYLGGKTTERESGLLVTLRRATERR